MNRTPKRISRKNDFRLEIDMHTLLSILNEFQVSKKKGTRSPTLFLLKSSVSTVMMCRLYTEPEREKDLEGAKL